MSTPVMHCSWQKTASVQAAWERQVSCLDVTALQPRDILLPLYAAAHAGLEPVLISECYMYMDPMNTPLIKDVRPKSPVADTESYAHACMININVQWP